MRIGRHLFICVVLTSTAAAQEPVRFEVASVKPVTPDSDPGPFGQGAGYTSPEGDVRITRADMLALVAQVLDVQRNISRLDFGGRKFQEVFNSRFDIEGKGGTGTANEKLHTLLVERFGLRTHKEVRQTPLYALKVRNEGKLGPYLRPSNVDCTMFRGRRKEAPAVCLDSPGDMRFGVRLNRYAGTIDELILRHFSIIGGACGTPVINETSLKGLYEWEIAFDPSRSPKPDVPNIFTALEDQLGLKLEKTVGPWEVIVIDHIQMPTPN